jgi:hypothetical protein
MHGQKNIKRQAMYVSRNRRIGVIMATVEK